MFKVFIQNFYLCFPVFFIFLGGSGASCELGRTARPKGRHSSRFGRRKSSASSASSSESSESDSSFADSEVEDFQETGDSANLKKKHKKKRKEKKKGKKKKKKKEKYDKGVFLFMFSFWNFKLFWKWFFVFFLFFSFQIFNFPNFVCCEFCCSSFFFNRFLKLKFFVFILSDDSIFWNFNFFSVQSSGIFCIFVVLQFFVLQVLKN